MFGSLIRKIKQPQQYTVQYISHTQNMQKHRQRIEGNEQYGEKWREKLEHTGHSKDHMDNGKHQKKYPQGDYQKRDDPLIISSGILQKKENIKDTRNREPESKRDRE